MIYIVEDDAAIRELEQYALQSSGYEVTSFESSEPFWQAMHAAEPELVILDVMLPGEDGFSILKKLRNTPSLRRLPIIMVTAKSSELDTVRGLDCGADDYISKPAAFAAGEHQSGGDTRDHSAGGVGHRHFGGEPHCGYAYPHPAQKAGGCRQIHLHCAQGGLQADR